MVYFIFLQIKDVLTTTKFTSIIKVVPPPAENLVSHSPSDSNATTHISQGNLTISITIVDPSMCRNLVNEELVVDVNDNNQFAILEISKL